MSKLPIEDHDSSVTVPLTDVMQARFTELARAADQARTQGYVEANFAKELLKLAQELVPLFLRG